MDLAKVKHVDASMARPLGQTPPLLSQSGQCPNYALYTSHRASLQNNGHGALSVLSI